MVMTVNGLNARRLQDVEKFDAHAALVELLFLLKDVVSNPKTLSDLAIAKAEALKLTVDEEKKRQDALDLIARTDELRNSFAALDEREGNVDQKHKDNLNVIEGMKADIKQKFDARDRALKEDEERIAKKHAVAEAIHKKSLDEAKTLENETRKQQEVLSKKEEYLKGWESEISRRHNELAERERSLFKG